MRNSYDDFFNKCFSPNWAEIVDTPVIAPKVEMKPVAYASKKLETLLMELDEIEENLQNILAKKWRLDNLSKFYGKSLLTD